MHFTLRVWLDVFQVYLQARWIINWVDFKTFRCLVKVVITVDTSLELVIWPIFHLSDDISVKVKQGRYDTDMGKLKVSEKP